MTGRRSDDILTDVALEREIEAALAVDPSPEFLVRVRGRIADDSRAAGPVAPFTLLALGATALVIIALMTVPHWHLGSPSPVESSLVPAVKQPVLLTLSVPAPVKSLL